MPAARAGFTDESKYSSLSKNSCVIRNDVPRSTFGPQEEQIDGAIGCLGVHLREAGRDHADSRAYGCAISATSSAE